jgi:hypothetical protein
MPRPSDRLCCAGSFAAASAACVAAISSSEISAMRGVLARQSAFAAGGGSVPLASNANAHVSTGRRRPSA